MRNLAPRLIFFLLLLSLITGISIAQTPDAAVSDADALSVFAAYVPQDTLLYAAVRADEASVAALDEALAEVTAGLSGVQIPPVETLLASMRLSLEEIRPWLGDSVALAVVPSSIRGSTIEPLLLLHVLDTEAASAYLLDENPNLVITAQDDVLLIAGSFSTAEREAKPALLDALIQAPAASRLDTNPAFADLTQTLDAPAYAALVFVDLPLLLTHMRFTPFSSGYYVDQAPSYAVLGRLFGPAAMGVTRAENGDLLLDIATSAPNLAGITPLGLRFEPPLAAPDMLAAVPHDALAVVHGSDLPGFFIELWSTYGENIVETVTQSGLDAMVRYGYAPPTTIFALHEVQDMSADDVANLILGNALGLTVDELHNWSAGDYVLFTRVNSGWRPRIEESTAMLPLAVAGVFEIGDAAQSYAAFEKLVRTLYLLRDGAGVRDHIDVDVTRAEGVRRVDVSVYIIDRESAPLTFSLIVTDSLAILGTDEAADAAFAQIGGETAAWLADAAANFRPNAIFNGAVQPSVLVPVINALIGGGDSTQQTLSQIRPFIAKIESLAFNVAVAPSGALVTRLSVSLNSAGDMETALGIPTLEPAPFLTFPPPPTLVPPPTVMMLPTVAIPPETTVEPLDPVILGATETAAAITQIAPITPTATFVPSQTPTFAPTETPAPPTIPPSPVPTQAALTFPTEPVTSALFNLPTFRTEDGAFILGSPDAPATLVIFSDWACPHCQVFNETTLQLIDRMGDGTFNIEHRTLVTAGGDATRAASHLAECTDIQRPGIFWEAREFLFGVAMENRDTYLDAERLEGALASRFEVDSAALKNCAAESGQLERDGQYALAMGANSTPFLVVRAADGTITPVTDRSLDGILAALAAAAGEDAEAPSSGASVQSTRAAGLANLAATRQAAQPTPTP